MQEIKDVPYNLPTGETKIAKAIPIDFSTEGLSHDEIRLLSSLSSAVNNLTPIFAEQQMPDALDFFAALSLFEKTISSAEDKKLFDDYMTIVSAANAPWDMYKRTIVFPFGKNQIPSNIPLHNFADILWHSFQPPVGAGLYPNDINEKEYSLLGERAKIENSTIMRGKDNRLEVVLNEVRFRDELDPVIRALNKAYKLTKDKDLAEQINANIQELLTGEQKDREESWKIWIQNNSNIGFLIGTAVETYLDGFKGIRGAAQGVAYRVNDKYQSLADTLASLLPEMEQAAPWKTKKIIDAKTLPHLKFVDVLASSGGYCIFPLDVMAESLPDDESIVKRFGSVNLVFPNLQEAVFRSGEIDYIVNEFIAAKSLNPYRHLLSEMYLKMTAVHELGHRTGTIKDDDQKKYFGENYSVLEEARAELFSMWALPYFVSKGIITKEQEIAGYYSMLVSMIKALQTKPVDHNGSRNMMFHYFMDSGAIVSVKNKYDINPEVMRESVNDLLRSLGNIRAEGDLESLEALKGIYIRLDKQNMYKQRLAGMPMGRLFVFPSLKNGQLTYPDSFRDQPKSIEHFVQ